MSIVTVSVKSGTVARDSAIRRATSCWVRVSSTIVTSPLAVAMAGSGAGAGAAGGWAPVLRRGGAGAAAGVGACGAGAAVEAGAAAGRFDVGLDSPAAGAGPDERGQVDAVLGGDARASGDALARVPVAGAAVAATGVGRRGRRRGWGVAVAGGGRAAGASRGWCGRRIADRGDQRADRQRVAFGATMCNVPSASAS